MVRHRGQDRRRGADDHEGKRHHGRDRRQIVQEEITRFSIPVAGELQRSHTRQRGYFAEELRTEPAVARVARHMRPAQNPGGETALFHFVMIKPTHYDDDGYPIQWIKSAIPSNTLACMNGLAEDMRRQQVLGPGVDLRLSTYDETNRRIKPGRIIREIRKAGGRALICLVGAQSNQFPRAMDLARPFLEAGLPVSIGGFHVSGCIAMLPKMTPELRE